MNRYLLSAIVAVALCSILTPAHAEVHHRIGGGVHYWRVLKDVDVKDVDQDGLAWMASYQLCPAGLFKLELAVEALPDGFRGATKSIYAPQAYLVLGSSIYAAIGVGGYYYDGDFLDQEFYALRAGLEFELLPRFYLDINANYRVDNWDGIKEAKEDIGSDSVTLGAVLRVEL